MKRALLALVSSLFSRLLVTILAPHVAPRGPCSPDLPKPRRKKFHHDLFYSLNQPELEKGSYRGVE